VLTNSAKTEDLRRSLTAGAKAYLLKGAQPRQVWNTIREVYAGKSSLPHDLAAQLAASMAQPRHLYCRSRTNESLTRFFIFNRRPIR
jgi:DNA-binding NarL/FixJ family response regulator